MPITDASDCAQSPQVVSNEDYLYLFWNHNGEIVYAPDFVARYDGTTDDRSEENAVILDKALITVDSEGTHKINGKNKFSPVHRYREF